VSAITPLILGYRNLHVGAVLTYRHFLVIADLLVLQSDIVADLLRDERVVVADLPDVGVVPIAFLVLIQEIARTLLQAVHIVGDAELGLVQNVVAAELFCDGRILARRLIDIRNVDVTVLIDNGEIVVRHDRTGDHCETEPQQSHLQEPHQVLQHLSLLLLLPLVHLAGGLVLDDVRGVTIARLDDVAVVGQAGLGHGREIAVAGLLDGADVRVSNLLYVGIVEIP
jgi:hypothetical protein